MGQSEVKIGPELAALGIYGCSVKPRNGWLKKGDIDFSLCGTEMFHSCAPGLNEPRHILYNLSEGALNKLLPGSLQSLVTNSLVHMRRVYPSGTRVTSGNLVPLEHWQSGPYDACFYAQ